MNVLIVGLGSIAKKHIATLQIIDPGVKIFALRSSSASSSWENVVNLYSLEELDGLAMDFAIISNPTSEHKAALESLKRLRIPFFIEKPLFHNLSISETVASIEELETLTYVACNLRFHESIRFVKEYIDSKKVRINEVNAYCGSYLPDWRKGVDYKTNYSAIPELGGGVHIDLIHEIDYLYWLFGSPACTSKTFTSASSLGIRSIDYANYCLSYPPFNVNVILNYYRRDAKRTLEVVGENETILVDLLLNRVSVNGIVVFQSDKQIADTYKEQLVYFIECMGKREKTFNTISDAFKVLQICLES